MLSKLEIKNYQSHKDTSLDLCEGVNILIGSSDMGKSSALRALNWLINNRPLGGSFKSWSAKKKDKVEVKLTTVEGSEIVHQRDGNQNSYLVDGELLEAHGADVPDEVREVLNLGDYNFQSQFSKYFLLQDSPGEVAKQLNKVASLDVIDDVTLKIKQLRNKNEKELSATKQTVEELEEEKEQYDYLPKVETLIVSLEDFNSQLEEKQKRYTEIENTINRISEIAAELETVTDWLEVEKEYKKIEQLIDKLKLKETDYRAIDLILCGIDDLKERQEEVEDLLLQEKSVDKLFSDIETLNNIEKEKSKLTLHIEDIEDIRADLVIEEKKIKELMEQYVGIVNEYEVCPFCFTKIGKKQMDHILECL